MSGTHETPAYTMDIAADGTVTYRWDDTAVVEVALHQPNKRGQYPVMVRFGEDTVSTGTVDIHNLADRERLHAHCRHLDGAVNWLQRFVQVAETLHAAMDGATRRVLQVTQLSTVTPERVEFWWRPFLPKGRPTAVEGDPGIGKSTLVLKIIAHLTTGRAFPSMVDGILPQDFSPQNVCLLTSEDDAADSLLPRLLVNGGDPQRVFKIDGWEQPDGEKGVVTMQDLDIIQQALEQYTPELIVFDPLQSFFGKGTNMNDAGDTRPILDAVAVLCKGYGCTLLCVRHIGKTQRAKALYSGLGSIDITANMRSVLFVGEDPDNPHRRILAHSKANYAQRGPSVACLLTSVEHELLTHDGDLVTVEAARVDWDGRSTLTADDLAAPPIVDDEDTSALDQAKEFLAELLQEGPVLSAEIDKVIKQAGITRATLRRAKPLVGVKARRREVEGTPSKDWPWEWYLS